MMNGPAHQWRPTTGAPPGAGNINDPALGAGASAGAMGIPGPGGGGMTAKDGKYPASREEATQFVTNIMQMIYSNGQHRKIINAVRSSPDPAMVIGTLAGGLVAQIAARRQAKTGREIRGKLIIKGVGKAIGEIVEMLDHAGIDITREQAKQATMHAAKVVAKQLQQMKKGGKPGGMPQPGGGQSPGQGAGVQPGAPGQGVGATGGQQPPGAVMQQPGAGGGQPVAMNPQEQGIPEEIPMRA